MPSPHDWHFAGMLPPRGDSDGTANTLSSRSVFFEPHDGQIAVCSAMLRTSFSNFILHDLHVYS